MRCWHIKKTYSITSPPDPVSDRKVSTFPNLACLTRSSQSHGPSALLGKAALPRTEPSGAHARLTSPMSCACQAPLVLSKSKCVPTLSDPCLQPVRACSSAAPLGAHVPSITGGQAAALCSQAKNTGCWGRSGPHHSDTPASPVGVRPGRGASGGYLELCSFQLALSSAK